jgi:glutamate-1-semialdehyde 2,1-aminomutase
MLEIGRQSAEIFELASSYIPGGVNTSLRTLARPLAFERAQGSKVYDADGREYVDYHAAFGPIILGHAHPAVNARVIETLQRLDIIGVGTTELEARLARKLVEHIPSAEKVLFCNSGSEATFSALRLARAVTGRKKIIKFQGCYHGWHDAVLMNVITPPESMGRKQPLSAGMLPEVVDQTLVLTFNDLDEVERTLAEQGEQVAAIILEPIPHNIGCVIPTHEFLAGVRRLSTQYGTILVFDEVVTGFRHALGGYQSIVGVTPDLTTVAKAMANGYPVAAICGRAELMDRFNTRPGGDVFFAGTFNAHPLATAAALATIEALEDGSVYRHIYALGDRARTGLAEIVEMLGVMCEVTGFGSVFVPYFMEGPIRSYADLPRNDDRFDLASRQGMVDRGFLMLPIALKRNHVSASHTEEDIDRTLQAAEDVLRDLLRSG